MFHLCSEPLLLSEAGIHGLCISLNTPVLNIDELPVGPARAALVLFDSGCGSLGLAVGVRSIETRQVAVFSYRATPDMQPGSARAIEDATRFAERMGFLFDDDVIASSDDDRRVRALCLWNDLTGTLELEQVQELDELAPPTRSRTVPLQPEPVEPVFEESSEPPPASEASPVASETGEGPLGKVRQPPLPAPAERVDAPPSDGGAARGRTSLLRRCLGGEREGSSRPGLLRRLGGF